MSESAESPAMRVDRLNTDAKCVGQLEVLYRCETMSALYPLYPQYLCTICVF